MKKFSFRETGIIMMGTLIVATAVYFFMLPSNVSVGSVTAFANVLNNFIPLSVSFLTFIINMILLLVGFLMIGKDFAAKSAFGSVLLPAYLALYELLFPDFQSLTQDPMLDVLCYILVVSVGQSILFSCNASTGGLEVVAKLLNKYMHMELGKAFSVAGMVVALSSAVCYDKKIVVLSVLGTYFGGLLVDKFSFGMNIKRKVCIISSKTDEIVHYILHDLHSGASLYDAIGAYDGTVRREINVIVDKQEYRALMDYMKRVDPKAFLTVYSVNEINYTPKK
jgi:uncharacterized membrane-anchored protein YitT (DUF2179 family)